MHFIRHDGAKARIFGKHRGPLQTAFTDLQSAAKLACLPLLVCMLRVPGTVKPSERWTKAAEAAHQGVIAKLRILSMDIVMATSDGTDRQAMQSPSCLPCFCMCTPRQAGSCTAELIKSKYNIK